MPRRRILTTFTPDPAPVPAPIPMTNSVNQHRISIYQYTPKDPVACRYRLDEIDRFYLACQKHRDFYKDLTNRLQPQFETRTKRFATRPDPTGVYVKLPVSRHQERKPVVYPMTMGRRGLNSSKTRFG